MNNITEREGLYFKYAGDERWHCDIKAIEKLWRTVPVYWEDTCPYCGNEEGISGCRCFVSHRICPKCNTGWHWDLDRENACMKVVVEKSPKGEYNIIHNET